MLSYLFGGAKPENENENPELAMREAMDRHGEFQTNLDGTLKYDDYVILRAIITRQAMRQFIPKKETLNARKMEAYREKNQQKYVAVFREGQHEFQQSIIGMTKKACEWIELDAQNYQLTVKQYMEDPEKRRELQEKDSEVRMALEAKEVTQSEADIISASKFKFKRDMEMFRKLQTLKFTSSPQATAEIQAIEMSKTSDALEEEFGFNLQHLAHASKHFNLEDNEELKSFRRLVIAQKESEEKAEFDRAQPPAEIIEQLVAEGKALGEP